jgi:hypothetical protein
MLVLQRIKWIHLFHFFLRFDEFIFHSKHATENGVARLHAFFPLA